MKNIICLTVRSAIAAGVLSLGEEIFRCTRTFEKIPRRRKRNMETARTHSLWNRARVLGGSAALLLMSTLASNALAQCLVPPHGQVFEDYYHLFVNVYTGPDHGGTCRTIPIDVTIADLGDPLWGPITRFVRSKSADRYASGCSTAGISRGIGGGGRPHRWASVGRGTRGLRLSASKNVPSSRTAATSPTIRLPSMSLAISAAIAESSHPAGTTVRQRWASRTIVSRQSAITQGRSFSIPTPTSVMSPVFCGYPASTRTGSHRPLRR